VTPETCRAVVR